MADHLLDFTETDFKPLWLLHAKPGDIVPVRILEGDYEAVVLRC